MVQSSHPPPFEPTDPPTAGFPRRRIGSIVGGLALAVLSTYVVPSLHHLRPWVFGDGYVPFWNLVGREFLGEEEQLLAEERTLSELKALTLFSSKDHLQPRVIVLDSEDEASEARPPTNVEEPPQARTFPPMATAERIERPAVRMAWPERLESYFRRLTQVELQEPGAMARASHYGDSVLGVDGITSGIRRRLQARFGDGGHGFHLMGRYNPSYHHQGIEFDGGVGWNRCLVVYGCRKKDPRYGYGGLTASSPGGAISSFGTASSGEFGKTASFFEVWFSRIDSGGNLEIIVDGSVERVVSTDGEEGTDGWVDVRVPTGEHHFRVRAAGGGEVRTYGVVLENDGPGVVWDGIALIGGSTRALRTQSRDHIAAQIEHRKTDLLVFLFGGNDLERGHVDLKDSLDPYYEEFGEVLDNLRARRPDLPCLIMSVLDHGKRRGDDEIVSKPFVPTLVEAQREVARRNGCAFYDTYAATGGAGTAARWFRASPRLMSNDLGHPNSLGHEVIAGLLSNALIYEYEQFRTRMVGQALDEPEP